MKKKSQKYKILKYLLTHQTITAMQALKKFGCFRLAARISDIKKMGLLIYTRSVTENGKTFAEYRLVE